MRSHLEFRGRCGRLEYDRTLRTFVIAPAAHPFTGLMAAATPMQKAKSDNVIAMRASRRASMWGKHVIIDMAAGNREKVRSAIHIKRFSETMVAAIDMKAYGDPLIEHFATHSADAAGYSLVQLIETSAITGHFCDSTGDAYIDIFSCKDFNTDIAVEVVRAAFHPEHLDVTTLMRQAGRRRGRLLLAAE